MIPCPHRVANRYLLGDLNPPLGGSDSPCDVLRRINDEVRNPKDKNKLIRLVENGKDLSNPQAHIVYDDITEKGVGKLKFKDIDITAHAQYRMDLRGVSVQELRSALYAFQKKIQVDKAQRGWSRLEDYLENDTVSYTAPNKLKVVFQPYLDGRGRDPIDKVTGCKVITVYFEGVANPKPPSESECQIRKAFRGTKSPTISFEGHLFQIEAQGRYGDPKIKAEMYNDISQLSREYPKVSFDFLLNLITEYAFVTTKKELKLWLKKVRNVWRKRKKKIVESDKKKVYSRNTMVRGIIITYHYNKEQIPLIKRVNKVISEILEKVAKVSQNFDVPNKIVIDMLDERDIEGYFLRGTKHITITNNTLKKENIEHVVCHEIGHFIFEHLDNSDKTLWDNFIDNNVGSLSVSSLMSSVFSLGLNNLTEFGVLRGLEKQDLALYNRVQEILSKPNNPFTQNNIPFTFKGLDQLRSLGVKEIAISNETLSSYAGNDKEELFAELFAHIALNKPVPPNLSEVWTAMSIS